MVQKLHEAGVWLATPDQGGMLSDTWAPQRSVAMLKYRPLESQREIR